MSWTLTTRIYFQPPSNFPDKPRPIMAAWKMVAEECDIPKPILVPSLAEVKGKEKVFEDGEKWERMSGAFAKWTESVQVTHKLVRWARFQLLDPELMKICWGINKSTGKQNNTQEEFRNALIEMRKHNRISPTFKAAFKAAPPFIDAESTKFLPKGKWTAEDFNVAYIFWAFVKGYRYSSSLNAEHIYAVHWLRRRAMSVDVKLRSVSRAYPQDLFPWGHFLSEMTQMPIFYLGREDLPESILNLRQFTTKNAPPTTDEKRIDDFVKEGLFESLPKKPVEEWFKMSSLTVSLAIALWQMWVTNTENDLRLIAPLIPFLIKDCIPYIVPKEQIIRRFQLLVYQPTISSLIKRNRPVLLEYMKYVNAPK